MSKNTKNIENLEIWEKVKQTDPQFTKRFRRAGGFEGTAVDPVYNIYRATEIFGPVGIRWGYEILNEQIIEGAPLFDNQGNQVGREKIHEMKVKLWFKHQGETGSLITSGATMVVSKNKYGVVTDEEAIKKSLTDAVSKGLSWLGFSADVHLGLFDDVKYVQGLKVEYCQKNGNSNGSKKPGENSGQQQASAPSDMPQIEGVSFKEITGKDGNKYVIAEGKTYNKKSILDKYGFQRKKGSDGKWVVYKPVSQPQAA